eukprot:TRINITY_DN15680_c0_g1_i1.p1 TRINITY_DN15680_c0_g1~~TRINITY_DN15680_c0_g1_i1.p1  ORF type:complete len:284 (-),score=61.51 TRINITY_DN15680_c0_g1_i1:213-1064(-)
MATRSSSRLTKKEAKPVEEEAPIDAKQKSRKSKKRKLSQLETQEEENVELGQEPMEALFKSLISSKKSKTKESEPTPEPTAAPADSKPKKSIRKSKSGSVSSTNEAVASAFTPTESTQGATQALLKLYKRLIDSKIDQEGYSVEPVDDNMYKWHVKLFGFDATTQIAQDLFMYESSRPGRDHVLMELIFPRDYPHSPPFMRVVFPRFFQYTGHITIGGSICIKELTRSGWTPEIDVGQLIIQIRQLLVEGGALIDMDNCHYDYTESEAKESFVRVAQAHGWQP